MRSGLPQPAAPAQPDFGVDPGLRGSAAAGPQSDGSNVIPFRPPQQQDDPLAPVRARVAGGESGGNLDPYTAKYGGGNFGFPDWEGRPGPAGISHAGGKFQFEPGTWKKASAEMVAHGAPAPDFSNPRDQDHVFNYWATKIYHANTGRNLLDDAQANRVDYGALAGEWPSLAPKTHAGTGDRPLRSMFGGELAGGAKQLADLALARIDRADAAYQRSMRSADDIYAMARAREMRLEAEEARPPRNMHDAWNTWGGVAGLLAVFGGFIGRSHATAALGAAGAMMEAANGADERNYDRSYKAWQTHLEFADRAIRRFNEDARQISEAAGKSYDHQLAELDTLSKIYQLPATITHEQIAQQTQQLDLAEKNRKYIEAANEDTELRNAARSIIAKEHPEYADAPVRQIPPDVWNNAYGRATRQRKGTEGAPVLLTDPKTGQAFTMVLGHPETAQTLTGEPYAPTAAQKVGTGSQAPPQPQTVDYTAKAIAGYRLAPLSAQAMRTPYGQQVMAKVFELNPDYDQSKWQGRLRGEVAFTAGKEAAGIRFFSVAIDHLGTMQEASEALAGHDVQRLNRLQNAIATELGYEGPVDFNFVKSVVGSEVSKAIIGGVGALADREELRVNLDDANSPEQLLGVIRFAKKLMAGQLSGYRLQAKNFGMSAEEFDKHLSEGAKRELGGGSSGTPAAGAPPPGGVIRYDAQGNRVQ
jgi:hypothetical protein